jgi:hypothetical protein
MTNRSPDAPPLDIDTAQRIAVMAIKPGARTLVGPGVLVALLRRITELELTEVLLRRELDQLHAHALEKARLRAHAMWTEQKTGGGADR